ncbi:MAG: Type III restriction protein res subunit [Candidatus Azambacteria bacterium GW2011_GWE1_42_9]|nr:MAG: Type III restriction protein res subunit [Candidatus Azambacteria bacterium GW2011_GWF1_41_10]KKS49549.1 MAG: Type III restriction protein res subunit [Candidatus Azambacteria bacterium GW2011_GWF2_42_22]KKS69426.1 MAG: Type III restriction protein res subunit [Candidatus Azambacteria bacterium GW2011_GWA2_42_62]KKS78939.1 MAG: Type III restriction protein res subunit [Candidatus Azambacteria bacterium GW2011_GWE1_42_9]KKT03660.1 MAG: Type III restriction protein res subunit [Candidatus
MPEIGVDFLKHLGSKHFKPNLKLWNEEQWQKVQLEAIERCVYSFEILGEKDLLTNIVTGGGKTTIIGAMIAYMMIVHDQYKFLILTPNTIVRERLVDEFDQHSESYIYDIFPFFVNSHEHLKNRISLHIMKPGNNAAGVLNGTIILGNIHQIYERNDNWKVIRDNVESLCIFNDEAHNTKAEQYNDLLDKLKPKRFFRLDTTATPDRLNGLHPDSKMIFVYDIAQAMTDKIIKRPIVFHPDINKVKLTYEDLETGKTISAEEVPWEEIERRKISARRYITSLKPMRQQIAIACELLEKQKMRTPKPYKPLLFMVAVSIDDAKNITSELEKIGEKYGIKKILLVHNETDDELKEAARDINKDPQTEYDAVVSVLMLREGWDVRNISVILLFRKFSYKMIDGQIFSVYGPQVIGRGLRRMSKNPEEWESLYIVDHPILKHAWLWDHLKATIYPEALDPANIIIDTEKIPEDKNTDKINEGEKTLEEAERFLNINDPTPEPPEVLEPIYEWQKYLDNYKYDFNRMDIEQDVTRIKSLNIDSEHVTSEKSDIPEIEIEKIARVTKTEDWSIEELKKQLTKQIHSMARYALLEYDRNPDERQVILVKIIRDHIRKGLLGGVELDDSKDEALLRRLWAIIDQVRDVFLTPELIEGIFMKKK